MARYRCRLMAVALAVEPMTIVAANSHLPAGHHEDCPRAIYMERERLKFVWGLDRYGSNFDYLAQNRDFWRVWGPKHMPECICPGQTLTTGTIVKLRPRGNGHNIGRAPVFRLHWGNISAPVYGELRARLSVYLFKTTRNIEVVDAPLERLAPLAGKGSKSVLRNLMAFESGRRH